MRRRPVPCPHGSPWDDGVAVARTLRAAGHEAYLVGGCVRDLLLARPVQDADVATSAHPEAVEALFPRTVAVGKSFGVVVVVVPSGANVEVATFRCDGAYIDGRRPASVVFTTAAEDVARRDFTINALLYDPTAGEVVDHVGGLDDLDARRLRAVGDAAARLAEDRLRVLRGLRFAAQLDLRIEADTWAAIRATPLSGLSGERIVQEWIKGLDGPRRGAWLRLVADSGRLEEFCAPLAAAGEAARAATAVRLDALRDDDRREVRAAAWLAACGAAAAQAWIDALPLANALRDAVAWLLRDAAGLPGLAPVARWRALQRAPTRAWTRWFELVGADAAIAAAAAEWERDPRSRRGWQAPLRAADLMALGCEPGPALGRILRAVEDAALAGAATTRDAALAHARGLLG